ncbi:hypothetical protein CCUG63695_01885 [Mycobacteroides franklinii]|uniref:DUF5302 domain-containing protein n=2 Tax=Mycobacteroides franklinii TaxID=948102 RepID=A0A4R8R740_9MYCO|nr:hypothetical protein CCUG64054_01958 [Mycobacteroides franklinii]TDZ52072.1 hypothetical protein CCUG63697_00543 [Mycobacteroides franklinii]TDZ55479.1 hypothetical protein CCUG63696_01961 [Mycobacteroides franklinii]TDZ62420.1 hypothetical protein CCUG63695_01885 [Mycobacteroides franklinii]TDZ68817.1 hypothetical protein CCUG64056_01958 [Mycobacteroides franklinii]
MVRRSDALLTRLTGMTDSKGSGDSAADDAKRKFREALDRKNNKASAAADNKDTASKPTHAHGRAGSHREFRRKSG